MSDAQTDTTEHQSAAAAVPGGAAALGRHRGGHSPADQAAPAEAAGHGRHRRAGQSPTGPFDPRR